MKKILLFSLAFFGIVAMMYLLWKKDPNDSEPDGGFCAYESVNYEAKVVDLYAADSAAQTFEVVFEVNRFDDADTLYYSYEFDDYLSVEKLRELDCRIGKTFRYEHKQLIEGACNPDLYMLHMEAYEAPKEESAY